MNEAEEFIIYTDEDGEEYTSFIAVVIDDNVETYPLVRKGDTEIVVENRMDSIANRFGRDPSDTKYFSIVRLYRTGITQPDLDGSNSSTYQSRGKEIALRACAELYDHVWPAVGESARHFVSGAVADVHFAEMECTNNALLREAAATGAIGSPLPPTCTADLLRSMLLEEEKEF